MGDFETPDQAAARIRRQADHAFKWVVFVLVALAAAILWLALIGI